MMTRIYRPATASLFGVAAFSLALGGCKIDDPPLFARWRTPATPIYEGLPAPGPLDPGYGAVAPVAAAPSAQAYAYPARAYALSRAVERAPPNYAIGYGEAQPWVWDNPDEGMMFAEPADDGWRSYYYDEGAPYPYFVQDPHYGYAYGDNGALVALFDAAGVLISADRYGPYEIRARDYWRRGHDFDRAYQYAPRYRVDDADWRARAPRLRASQDRWFQAAAAQPAWRGAEAAYPHDNGRHRGWDKDRGRQVAVASPPPAWAAHARPEPGAIPARLEERRDARPAGPREAQRQREDQAPRRGWREANQERPPQHGRAPEAPRSVPEMRQGRDGGGKGERSHGGGRDVAQAGERHAPPAAVPPQQRHGGGSPPGQDRGDHGGGAKGGHGHGKGE
jgi:hypothetical protein